MKNSNYIIIGIILLVFLLLSIRVVPTPDDHKATEIDEVKTVETNEPERKERTEWKVSILPESVCVSKYFYDADGSLRGWTYSSCSDHLPTTEEGIEKIARDLIDTHEEGVKKQKELDAIEGTIQAKINQDLSPESH